MTISSRLHDHYDSKYIGSNAASVKPTPVLKYPRHRVEMSVHLARRFSGKTYLEIGAGSGSSMLSLLDKYAELVGTELSAVRAEQLRALFANRSQVKILENNLEEEPLPFNDAYFDTIALTDVIEHLFDPIGSLEELFRVLKPGGVVLLHTPNIAKWTRRLKLLAGYFPSTASLQEGLLCYDRKTRTDLHDEGHLHYFTYRSLERIALERVGFSRVLRFGYGSVLARFHPPLFSEISMALQK
jgi:SAM-dependent methyltransferase